MEINKIYCMDCLDGLKELESDSVNLAVLDPPYYKIKKDAWDNQWKTFNDYLSWIEQLCVEVKRVLKNNGSFYIFCDDQRAAYIQVILDQHMTFLNHLVWYKRNNLPIKYAHNHRKYCPVSERILFYSLQDQTGLETVKLDLNNFTSLRQYFKDFQEALGLSLKQINATLGHRKAEHAFYWGSTQWDLPTEETYKQLCDLPLKYEFVRKEYEELRKEYEELRKEYEELRKEYEELRRPFNYSKGMYEVFDIPIINGKENTPHPTTKPLELIKRLVEVSSNEGDLVLDPTMGSGTTALACIDTGREYIGFENNVEYFNLANKRINEVSQQARLF